MSTYQKPSDIIKEGEKTSTMLFPHRVVVNLGGTFVDYPEGVHEVPESLTNFQVNGKDTGLHWYLKANKVKAYAAPKYPPDKLITATADHLEFAKSVGVSVESVADMQKFLNGLNSTERAAFLTDFKEFQAVPKEKTSAETEGEQTPPDLNSMSKKDLAAHAKDVHGLELNPKENTKEELISAIQEAAAKKG